MKLKITSLMIWLSIILCVAAVAQSDREFTDKVDNFKITLAGEWQPAFYVDAFGRQKTEFVFKTRAEGVLKITRESLPGRSLANKVSGDLEDLNLGYACVYTSQEAIKGLLGGTRVALYYFDGSRTTVGTYYYLQDGDSVWILRFTGRPGSPGMARDMTDKMARSFCSVCGLQ